MFKTIVKRISSEPVVFWGLVQKFANSVIALGLIFAWFVWTPEQIGAVMLVVAGAGLFLDFFVRRQVEVYTPSSTPTQ